jgi:hypothetical protein
MQMETHKDFVVIEPKRSRKKRKIEIDEGVSADTISLYITRLNKPDVKISFLYRNNELYKDFILIYVDKDKIDDLLFIESVNHLYRLLKWYGMSKVNQVYQAISEVFSSKMLKDFEVRHLLANPYFQAKHGNVGYVVFDEMLKDYLFKIV